MNAPESMRTNVWRAQLALAYERRGPRSVLAVRNHEGPLLVQRPLYPEGDEVCHTIVVHPPGGVAAGDALALRVRVGEAAQTLLTTPGATRWYRSDGLMAAQTIDLNVRSGAQLEWLPQENIVFRGAAADNDLSVTLAADARFVGWDLICLGRIGSGERFDTGTLRSRVRIAVGDRLIWYERGCIEGGGRVMKSPLGLDGAPVFAAVYAVGPDLDNGLLDALRAIVPGRGQAAVTRLPGLLLARCRGDSTQAAREYCAAVWKSLRPRLLRREAVEPRIWGT
jgi:urease accessory protein